MSESTTPSDSAPQAEGMVGGEGPATIFPEEELTEGATEQEEADRREGTVQRGGDEETLGPGGPGASVDPESLR